MFLSEALEEVSKMYVAGAFEFYNHSPNNPWQDAHDKLEGAILLHRDTPTYFQKQDLACRQFVKDMKRLIDAYKAANPEPPSEPSLFDAFVIGNKNKVKQLQSLSDHSCVGCGTKESVRATTHRSKGPGIYCERCLKEIA